MNTRYAMLTPLFVNTLTALILLPLLGGCGDLLKQPYPAKSYYGIETGLPLVAVARPSSGSPSYVNADSTPQATSRPASAGAMLVRAIRVVPPYDGLAFVYRDAPSQYETDYYVNWIATPSALLTGSTTEWLDRSGPLPVIAAGSTVRTDITLDGEVTRLLVDRTDRARPRSVVSVRFILSRQTNAGTTVLSDTSYSNEIPVSTDDAAGYAAAYGQAFRQVLQRLTTDLQAALQTPTDNQPAQGMKPKEIP